MAFDINKLTPEQIQGSFDMVVNPVSSHYVEDARIG